MAMLIPVRILHLRMQTVRQESQPGLFHLDQYTKTDPNTYNAIYTLLTKPLHIKAGISR
jgi:hypothetical protein